MAIESKVLWINMADVLVKMRKPALTLPEWEQVHIYKDPPRSYYTKQKIMIDDVSSRNAIADAEQDRFEDHIAKVPRGVNLMKQSLHGPMKLQTVRPPMQRMLDLEPLSRRRRKDVSAFTNPNASNGHVQLAPERQFDRKKFFRAIQSKVLSAVAPTLRINSDVQINRNVPRNVLQKDQLNLMAHSGIYQVRYNDDRVLLDPSSIRQYVQKVMKTTNASDLQRIQYDWSNQQFANYGIKDHVILQSLVSAPNFNIVVADANTHDTVAVKATVQEKELIALASAAHLPIHLKTDGDAPVKLSNYRAKVVHSAKGTATLQIVNIQPSELLLERKTPAYYMTSAIQGDVFLSSDSNHDYNLQRNMPVHMATTNAQGQSNVLQTNQEFQLEKNTPYHAAQSGYKGSKSQNFAGSMPLELESKTIARDVSSGKGDNNQMYFKPENFQNKQKRDFSNKPVTSQLSSGSKSNYSTERSHRPVIYTKQGQYGSFENTGVKIDREFKPREFSVPKEVSKPRVQDIANRFD